MQIPKDDSERKALNDVREHGLHIIHVMGDENMGPCFSYSVGLFKNYAHAEIIVIGLRQELAQTLLNNMAWDIKNGKIFTTSQFHADVLDDFLCYFGDVPQTYYEEYVGWDLWFYEGFDFPLIQCIYPTVKGKFPWENDFPEDVKWNCLILTEPPTES